ncbi:MAG: hypothetical protein IJ125_03365 [Atopobiaceae bacterium]|nr:hypothetical protein [Atopobiaceae bacterium]
MSGCEADADDSEAAVELEALCSADADTVADADASETEASDADASGTEASEVDASSVVVADADGSDDDATEKDCSALGEVLPPHPTSVRQSAPATNQAANMPRQAFIFPSFFAVVIPLKNKLHRSPLKMRGFTSMSVPI